MGAGVIFKPVFSRATNISPTWHKQKLFTEAKNVNRFKNRFDNYLKISGYVILQGRLYNYKSKSKSYQIQHDFQVSRDIYCPQALHDCLLNDMVTLRALFVKLCYCKWQMLTFRKKPIS